MVKLNIVGVGPGSADYVPPIVHRIVLGAHIVIGAQRSLDLFRGNVSGETHVLTAKNIDGLLSYAVESSKKGRSVVILSTGDPGFSGLLKSVLNTKLITSAEINVVPGVSAIQACAARLGLCWDEACLFTFHQGNVSDDRKIELLACLKAGRDVILFPDANFFLPKEIAAYLINSGFDQNMLVFICENLTLDNERIVKSSLKDVLTVDFNALCVMVIKAKREAV
ncbi:MAG: precorrin-6y C5,15-methyltransferase (decarboxylating) subunit CbiE [Nitrososphaerota archaeon]|jgi:cobalt-precorrin-7 (C5)-methyltransferase|nr:precorrin-6y C5,15-methyltransferase (decarboxylating) subunit CbiE [Nitrososphaerota archaeon]